MSSQIKSIPLRNHNLVIFRYLHNLDTLVCIYCFFALVYIDRRVLPPCHVIMHAPSYRQTETKNTSFHTTSLNGSIAKHIAMEDNESDRASAPAVPSSSKLPPTGSLRNKNERIVPSHHGSTGTLYGSKDKTVRLRPSAPPSSSRRFVYSTDDDRHEVEADWERDYIVDPYEEIKERRRAKMERHASHPHGDHSDYDDTLSRPNSPAMATLRDTHGINDGSPHLRNRRSELIDELLSDDNEGGDTEDAAHVLEHESHDAQRDDSGRDDASTTSIETFTLRERQDAINTTHPFGIRIWKPAIYKKIRSVQRIAEGDIHSIPGKEVPLSVWIGNMVWTIAFGTILMILCSIASAVCLTLVWSESAQQYGRSLFHLGVYLWFPFGQYVELAQDENYLHEDRGEGRSAQEYQRWQAGDVEFGRLFFGPGPRRTRTPTSSNRSIYNEAIAEDNEGVDATEEDTLLNSPDSSEARRKRRLFGRGQWNIGRVLFYLLFYIVLLPVFSVISLICWLGVFSIPMAKVLTTLTYHLRKHPLALSFQPARAFFRSNAMSNNSSILLCTYRAMGMNYYKYTVDGTNVIIINLMGPVLFVIFDYFVLDELMHYKGYVTAPAAMFSLSLLSVIPLAYFIGQAVASISAQSSMGMGAAINAFFSTVVEVFLYSVALSQGKGDLVEGSIVGSVLAGILLLPGLSMCAGAIKRKTQRYNPRSAGVSSTMLVFAVIGAFAPTIFYQIFGSYELHCAPCFPERENNCRKCQFDQVPLMADEFYFSVIQPFSYICAVLLFVSYCIGLWFTLRTHAAMIWATPTQSEMAPQLAPAAAAAHAPILQLPEAVDGENSASRVAHQKSVTVVTTNKEEQEGGGHDAPNWSRTKSTVILLGATLLYAIIAEILVDTVDVVLQNFRISQKLLGITVFALVPNTTEFLNAISFAMNGNIALSMEIGSAYALQVCLLQIPALVLYSIWLEPSIAGPIRDFMFTLVFPRWELWMVIFCVFLFSYIYAEGKSNYFKGSILILSYVVVICGFYFADVPVSELSPFRPSLIIQEE